MRVKMLRIAAAALILFLVEAVVAAESNATGAGTVKKNEKAVRGRKMMGKLIKSNNTVVLNYHKGEIFSGDSPITVYPIWYGTFTQSQHAVIVDFINSISPKTQVQTPDVAKWWEITKSYTDSKGKHISSNVKLGREVTDTKAAIGKSLRKSQVQQLVKDSIDSGELPVDSRGVYLVLTGNGIDVDGFCTESCAYHSYLKDSTTNNPKPKSPATTTKISYAWVGNAGSRCPGKCAWPYANGKKFGGPNSNPLRAPNGDVGIDGMIVNIASMIVNTATNPYDTGYYEGNAEIPLEAATACSGTWGWSAYPDFREHLLTSQGAAGVSYNAHGINNRKFLVPALWNPKTDRCSCPLVVQ